MRRLMRWPVAVGGAIAAVGGLFLAIPLVSASADSSPAADATKVLALADDGKGKVVSEASPVGSEQKVLTSSTRPSAAGASGSARAGRAGRLVDTLAAGEWDKVESFMRQHSPVRHDLMDSQPDGPRRLEMMTAALRDYRTYQRALGDPALVSAVLARVKLEDEIYDLARQVRQADPGAKDALSDQLHQKVTKWIDSNLSERQLWLDRLKTTLQTQQLSLMHDRVHRDEIIQQRYNEILRKVERFNFPVPSRDNRAATSQPSKGQ